MPPLKGDSTRRSTVLPYLEAHHYEVDRDYAGVYFTEHDINGELGYFENSVWSGTNVMTPINFLWQDFQTEYWKN